MNKMNYVCNLVKNHIFVFNVLANPEKWGRNVEKMPKSDSFLVALRPKTFETVPKSLI